MHAITSEVGYLSLEALAVYSGLSVRTLQRLIADPTNPIPVYRFTGRVFRVRRSDFDEWAKSFRVERSTDEANAILDRMVKG